MSNVNLEIKDYQKPYASLNGSSMLNITKFDIARGIISIGKTHWAQKYLSKVTLLDLIHYWSGLITYLDEKPYLKVNQRFIDLNPTDKVGKSYSIGSGITSIVASKKLKISCLQHVDNLIASGVVTITVGTLERGDMVGIDVYGDWHVLEAKGRTYPSSATDRKKAKRQAERITTINGIFPKTKGYCMTYINSSDCNILLCDPDDETEQSLELIINTKLFIRSYYKRIFGNLLNRSPDMTVTLNNLIFLAFRIDNNGEGTYLALENRIFENLTKENIDGILELQDEIFSVSNEINIIDGSLGCDGVLFFEGPLLDSFPKKGFREGIAPSIFSGKTNEDMLNINIKEDIYENI